MNRFPFLPISLLLTGGIPLSAQTVQSPISATLYRLGYSAVKTNVEKVTAPDVHYTEIATLSTSYRITKAELRTIKYGSSCFGVLNPSTSNELVPVPTYASASQLVMTHVEPASTTLEPSQYTSPTLARPADEITGARSIIKYAPLSSFGYEHVLRNNHSIYAGISLYSLGFGASAIGLKAEYRFYGLIKSSPKQAPEGFWVAPTLLFWRIKVSDFYGTSAFVSQIGGIAGYQWIFNQRISLEPALGISLTAVGSDSDTILSAGTVPLFALRVGYVLK